MKPTLLACAFCLLPTFGGADTALIDRAIDEHILPRFETLAGSTQALAETAAQTCDAAAPTLRQAYHTAFDAWVAASHLRFGPTETNDRAFAIAFWPDTRSKTPKALRKLITSGDAAVHTPAAFAEVSIAARGFYALDYLLFDAEFTHLGTPSYRCALLRAITTDTARQSADTLADWQASYAQTLRTAGQNDRYATQAEGLAEVFKAVITGYQFTKDLRLGRPLGTFDKPRPKRAEAWRSARALRNVEIATTSATDLAVLLSGDARALTERYAVLSAYFAQTLEDVDDPTLSLVSTIKGRNRVESVQIAVTRLLDHSIEHLGPHLNVTQGFNALDGD